MRKTFGAGAAQVRITPNRGSILGVDFISHYARFIHDELYAKSLVLKSGEHTIAFVVVDICIMPSDLLAKIKKKITHATDIPFENIMLCCTHTHGAGNVAGLLGSAVDITYRNSLPDLVVTSVREALNNLKPAKMTGGSVAVPGHQRCRRYAMDEQYKATNPITGLVDKIKTNPFGAEHLIKKPAAMVDPNVGFIGIKDLDDNWISVIGNYACHYAGDYDVDTVTSDYYGAFARHLKNNLDADEDFVGILTYGTGGDVNTWDFGMTKQKFENDFEKTEYIGEDLAERVIKAVSKLSWEAKPEFKRAYETMELHIRKPSKEQLEEAKILLETHRFENLVVDEQGIVMVYAREQLLLSAYSNTHTSALQAFKIGNTVIGAMGGELFSETGLWLKSQVSKYNFFTICLANTYDGYVPPAHEIEKGGYETWRARSSFLEEQAEEKQRMALLNLIQKMDARY